MQKAARDPGALVDPAESLRTPKHPEVMAWLTKNPQLQLHFTSASSSWFNLVERWFQELTDKALRRRAFIPCPSHQHDRGVRLRPQYRAQAPCLDRDRNSILKKGRDCPGAFGCSALQTSKPN